CDAGSYFQGKVSKKDILFQIDYLVKKRYPRRKVPVEKFKIQFARTGEPAFNEAVLKVLDSLPALYDAPGLMPCISSVAPRGRESFFEKLLEIKKRKYSRRFQLQFSIHTTNEELRNRVIPIKKWSFSEIARYGERFFDKNGRKIALNFALANGFPLEPEVLLKYFSPDIFLIKITPVNPTYTAIKHQLSSERALEKSHEILDSISQKGFEVILSIGELEENKIGSNCGQYVLRHLKESTKIRSAYSYELREV
ncbi:radical SAM protein, partial [Candidatus Aminicenantes bacterium AC-334-K16]|nr:radical SAM protein [Candidatus Aminicenantes bacterium AC-334-K16]